MLPVRPLPPLQLQLTTPFPFRPGTNVIMRRHKSAALDPATASSATPATNNDDDRPMRRVSYLRATANDSSLQLMDAEADAAAAASASAAAPTNTAAAEAASAASPTGTDGAQLGAMLPAGRSPDGIGYDAQTIAQQLKR